MTNPFLKQMGQSAADVARKMAKQMVQEPLEIAKVAKSQLIPEGAKGEGVSSPEPVKQVDEPNLPKPDEVAINASAASRLSELQSHVRQLIEERQRKTAEWHKVQDQEMGINQDEPGRGIRELIQPTSKRKSGHVGPGKGKQGTKEIGKGPSG